MIFSTLLQFWLFLLSLCISLVSLDAFCESFVVFRSKSQRMTLLHFDSGPKYSNFVLISFSRPICLLVSLAHFHFLHFSIHSKCSLFFELRKAHCCTPVYLPSSSPFILVVARFKFFLACLQYGLRESKEMEEEWPGKKIK